MSHERLLSVSWMARTSVIHDPHLWEDMLASTPSGQRGPGLGSPGMHATQIRRSGSLQLGRRRCHGNAGHLIRSRSSPESGPIQVFRLIRYIRGKPLSARGNPWCAVGLSPYEDQLSHCIPNIGPGPTECWCGPASSWGNVGTPVPTCIGAWTNNGIVMT